MKPKRKRRKLHEMPPRMFSVIIDVRKEGSNDIFDTQLQRAETLLPMR